MLALGLVALSAGGPLGCGAVAGVEVAQSEFALQEAGFVLDALGVVVEVGLVAVLTDEGSDDVDVVVGVPDRSPAASRALVLVVDPGGGNHAPGDVRPLLVRQDPVGGGIADGQVPHMLGGAAVLFGVLHGLVEEVLELLQGGLRVAAGVGGVVVPGSHEVRVGVLLVRARPVQVGEQADGALPALVDPGDHDGGVLLGLVQQAVGGGLDAVHGPPDGSEDRFQFFGLVTGVDGAGDLVEVVADAAEVPTGGEQLGDRLAVAGDGGSAVVDVVCGGHAAAGEEGGQGRVGC